jgi:hypothetical protein
MQPALASHLLLLVLPVMLARSVLKLVYLPLISFVTLDITAQEAHGLLNLMIKTLRKL